MTVFIREVISEVVLTPEPESGESGVVVDNALLESLVRRAAERVIEQLRFDWGK